MSALHNHLALGAALALVALGCGDGLDIAAEKTGDLSNPAAERRDPSAELVMACGAPAFSAGAGLVRAPYVQQVGDRSASVLWTASSDEPLTVDVTLPDGTLVSSAAGVVDASAHPPRGARQFVARVEDLEPDRIHCYSLRRGEQRLSERVGFRTAPPPGAPVRFAAFGDSGDGGEQQRIVMGQLRTVPLDLVLHAGDVAYERGTRDELERNFFDVYAPLLRSHAFYPVAGNHDYDTEDGAPLREAFDLPARPGDAAPERWYSFDWGDVHFVGLDTEVTGAEQAAWLDRDLTANTRPWTVVFGHRPPFSSGEHGSSASFRDYFVPVLEKHRVPLVLSGHDHHYERTVSMNGVTYVVTGGGGRETRDVSGASFTAFAEAVAHIVFVTVTGDELLLHAIDGTGREFDSLSLRR